MVSPEGRSEKRIPLYILVHLVDSDKPHSVEQAYTQNVSARGARLVTKRRWHPSEQPHVSLSKGEFRLPGRVVYCKQRSTGNFEVGLEFKSSSATWWNGTS
jgi:PilZ domain-containing protein